MSGLHSEPRVGSGRGQILLAAIIAPPIGLISDALLLLLAGHLHHPPFDPFRGREVPLFLLLLLGACFFYLLEFLFISYFRTRRHGKGLSFGATVVVFGVTGLVFSPLITGILIPIPTLVHWIGVGLLGTVGGLLSGATFWMLAPEMTEGGAES